MSTNDTVVAEENIAPPSENANETISRLSNFVNIYIKAMWLCSKTYVHTSNDNKCHTQGIKSYTPHFSLVPQWNTYWYNVYCDILVSLNTLCSYI